VLREHGHNGRTRDKFLKIRAARVFHACQTCVAFLDMSNMT